MIAHDFRALVVFGVTVAIWAGLELVLGRRTDRKELGSTNRWSELAINASTVVAVLAALVLSSATSGRIRPVSAFALGIAAMGAGVAIRMASAQSLGADYTLTVGLRPGQEVCDSGPYRWVRHPGYAGTMIALLGLGTALMNWYSVLAIALIVPALVVRIALEERMLTRAFAPAYEAYCRRTRWRVLPGVI